MHMACDPLNSFMYVKVILHRRAIAVNRSTKSLQCIAKVSITGNVLFCKL